MGTSKKKEGRRQKRALREAAGRILSKRAIRGETVILAGDERGKMSESILHLAEPLLDLSMDEAKALSLATIAWNLSLVPRDERGSMLEKLLRPVAEKDPEMEREMRVLLKDLVERKLGLYPDDRRMILGHEIAGAGDDMMLNVVSTLMP